MFGFDSNHILVRHFPRDDDHGTNLILVVVRDVALFEQRVCPKVLRNDLLLVLLCRHDGYRCCDDVFVWYMTGRLCAAVNVQLNPFVVGLCPSLSMLIHDAHRQSSVFSRKDDDVSGFLSVF